MDSSSRLRSPSQLVPAKLDDILIFRISKF
jgi:hypothetical protein